MGQTKNYRDSETGFFYKKLGWKEFGTKIRLYNRALRHQPGNPD
jgi:hypothetical protein